MEKVEVNKKALLKVLRANRTGHRKIMTKAQEGYRAAVIRELDAMLKEARDGRSIRVFVNLVQPMDQTADYDRAIQMLEMSVAKTVLLSETDFNSYVLDNWAWKNNFTTTNAVYMQQDA